MATFVFDGSSSITAAKTDTVVITGNPALFTNLAENNGNSVFTYTNGTTLTITGSPVAAGNYPNVSLANGQFLVGSTGQVTTGASVLSFQHSGTLDVSGAGTANSVKAVFGGLGVADPADGDETTVIGGKGSFLVYGNAGNDVVNQASGVAFDSQSFATVFGGKGADQIILTNGGANNNVGAKLAIYGGENTAAQGNDIITVQNGGTGAATTIFGGQGAADANDGADTITFNGGGLVNIYGNAGDDTITLGGTGGLAASTNAVVYGGLGKDTIAVTVNNVNATVTVYGSENLAGAGNEDTITVSGNTGNTIIYGGTAAADANDNADIINFSGQGTATIFAAGGNDSINLLGNGTATLDSTSAVTVYGGNGADTVSVLNSATVSGTHTIVSGTGADIISFGNTNAATNDPTALTVTNIPGVGAPTNTTESSTVTFQDLASGNSVTVGGLTFTATQDITAAQVADNFDSLAAGSTAVVAQQQPDALGGVFSGTLTGFSSAAKSTADVTFTSSTANTNVTNLSATTSSSLGSGLGNTITDFQVGAGNDTLRISNGVVGGGTLNIVDGATATTQATALNLAIANATGGAGAGKVSAVVFQGSAYVVVNNDGNATFDAGADFAVKLTGVTDLAQLSTATVIV